MCIINAPLVCACRCKGFIAHANHSEAASSKLKCYTHAWIFSSVEPIGHVVCRSTSIRTLHRYLAEAALCSSLVHAACSCRVLHAEPIHRVCQSRRHALDWHAASLRTFTCEAYVCLRALQVRTFRQRKYAHSVDRWLWS